MLYVARSSGSPPLGPLGVRAAATADRRHHGSVSDRRRRIDHLHRVHSLAVPRQPGHSLQTCTDLCAKLRPPGKLKSA